MWGLELNQAFESRDMRPATGLPCHPVYIGISSILWLIKLSDYWYWNVAVSIAYSFHVINASRHSLKYNICRCVSDLTEKLKDMTFGQESAVDGNSNSAEATQDEPGGAAGGALPAELPVMLFSWLWIYS